MVKVIRSLKKSCSIKVTKTEIIVRAPLFMPTSDINKLLESKKEWIQKTRQKVLSKPTLDEQKIAELKKAAKAYIPRRADYFAKQMGVRFNKISIRHQKTRWGSCSSKGNLNFNCALMMLPQDIIDYVIVHELCHLKHMNHKKQFWAEVEKVMPDYKQKRKFLKSQPTF